MNTKTTYKCNSEVNITSSASISEIFKGFIQCNKPNSLSRSTKLKSILQKMEELDKNSELLTDEEYLTKSNEYMKLYNDTKKKLEAKKNKKIYITNGKLTIIL